MKKKKKDTVTMSVPEGLEFGVPYSTHNELYYDTERNKDPWKPSNTALNPTNIFSKLDSSEAICARIDDKLARISNRGINDETEDTVDDVIGYLLLLKMSMDRE